MRAACTPLGLDGIAIFFGTDACLGPQSSYHKFVWALHILYDVLYTHFQNWARASSALNLSINHSPSKLSEQSHNSCWTPDEKVMSKSSFKNSHTRAVRQKSHQFWNLTGLLVGSWRCFCLLYRPKKRQIWMGRRAADDPAVVRIIRGIWHMGWLRFRQLPHTESGGSVLSCVEGDLPSTVSTLLEVKILDSTQSFDERWII